MNCQAHALYRNQLSVAKWIARQKLAGRCEQEISMMITISEKCFGYFALQLGISQHLDMLAHFQIQNKLFLASSDQYVDNDLLYAEPQFLPLENGCCDLTVIHHLHELVEDPHGCILEASRIVRPEGTLIVIGNNPSLLWQLLKMIKKEQYSWQQHRIHHRRLKDWLRLLQFDEFLVRHGSVSLWLDRNFPIVATIVNSIFSLLPFCGSFYCIQATKRTPSVIVLPNRKKYSLVSPILGIPNPTIKSN